MPSACTKPDQKTSAEASDPMLKVINVVDKKVRNLEKRKGKLDGYREKFDQGEELNADQKEAIEKYDGVVQNLEFAKDLQKQFLTIQAETEKQMRRNQKKERLERQSQEICRIRDLLQIQGLLDGMGSDTARADFLSGNKGAVVLTEDNLTQLDELYKLISPTREGATSYIEQLMTGAEHLTFLLEGKDKEILGTTYKELHDMIGKIEECGYFNHVVEEEEEEEVTPVAEEVPEQQGKEVTQPEADFTGQKAEAVTESVAEVGEQLSQQELKPTGDNPPTLSMTPSQQPPAMTAYAQENEVQAATASRPGYEEEPSYFAEPQYPRQRPFQEIMSSVQGTFNFLQESHVDLESPAHMDPAVVAAHPMLPQTDSSLTQHSYQSPSMMNNDDLPAAQYQTSPSQYTSSQYSAAAASHIPQPNGSPVEQTLLAEQQQPAAPQQQMELAGVETQQYSDISQHETQSSSYMAHQSALESQYGVEQSFSQTYSQSLPTTQQQHTAYGDQTSSLTNQLEQSLVMTSASGPQPIPLPNQTLPGQPLTASSYASGAATTQGYVSAAVDNTQGYSSATDSSQSYVTANNSQTSQTGSDSSEEKKPFLNPNASLFRPAGPTYTQADLTMTQDAAAVYSHVPNTGAGQDSKGYGQQYPAASADYQNNYYGSGSPGFNNSGFSGNRGSRSGSAGSGVGSRSGNRDSAGSRDGTGNRGGNRTGGSNSMGGAGNGYMRSASGGSNRTGGAPYGRGSYGGSNRGGNSGGGNRNPAYQGYPPSRDYRPEGFQGYGNNTFTSGGFNKGVSRGGTVGGGSGGGQRGGNPNRQPTGSMRGGGPPRNNNNMPRGNPQRSGSYGPQGSGGYGRPGSAGGTMSQAAV